MGANSSIPEPETSWTTPTLTWPAPRYRFGGPPDNSSLLTEGQKRRIFEKEVIRRGFEGNMTIDSDPAEAIKHAQLEYLNALHWGDKDSRMVLWAKGCNIDGIPGLGIVSNSSPDPEQ
jgi:hypothetical protein